MLIKLKELDSKFKDNKNTKDQLNFKNHKTN